MNTDTLRRLLGEATPRPWNVWEAYNGAVLIERVNPDAVAMACVADCYGIDAHINAALIIELVNNADELLAENKRLRAAKCPTWSFIRTLLEQGAAIRQDYDAGKFGESYEAYSARIDEAAREREDALTALEQKP